MSDTPLTPAELVRIEAAALEALAHRLDGPMQKPFERLCTLIVDAAQDNRRVILSGIGKSGLIARKIAATFVSTGTPAQFLHPSEALHGDIGILTRGDILLALSYSGETAELLALLPAIQRIGATLISLCGCTTSTLAEASIISLDVSVSREACGLHLAPTASTTAMLALGDALAIEVSRTLGFKAHNFATLHPGGQLGRRLSSVGKLMHSGDALPTVPPTATMPEIIHEMSARRLGMTTVQTAQTAQAGSKLLGLISDGDLRRLFERDGPEAFHKTAAEVMNPNPLTIAPEPLASEALLQMEQRKITALIVTTDGTPASPVQGVLHIHDLWDITPPQAT
jgi:arabinose-5-phosphate isomerase